MNKTKSVCGWVIVGAALALLAGTGTGFAQQAPARQAAPQAAAQQPAPQQAAPQRAAPNATAETAARPAAAAAAEDAQKPVFRPRDLMTPVERQAFRLALREAPTQEARQQVRERLWATLRQRAIEHGGTLAEPGQRRQRTAQNENTSRRDTPPRAP